MISQTTMISDFNVDPYYADDTTFGGTNQQGKKDSNR